MRPGPGTSSRSWSRCGNASLGLTTLTPLVARANLARWTGDAGDPAAARDLFAALLPARERVSGAEHPDTLTVRAYLAHWTGEAGDAAAARDLFAALLPVRERVSGPDHPNTVTVRTDLAAWRRQADQLTGSRDTTEGDTSSMTGR